MLGTHSLPRPPDTQKTPGTVENLASIRPSVIPLKSAIFITFIVFVSHMWAVCIMLQFLESFWGSFWAVFGHVVQ